MLVRAIFLVVLFSGAMYAFMECRRRLMPRHWRMIRMVVFRLFLCVAFGLTVVGALNVVSHFTN